MHAIERSTIVNSPVLLCGFGRVGAQVLECLRTAGIPVVVIDPKLAPDDPRLFGVRLVQGDCRDARVLDDAGLAHARGVMIVTSDDLVNLTTALLVRRHAPHVRIVLRMFNQNLVNRLGKVVTNVSAHSVSALAAPLLALTATTGDVLASFAVGDERRQVIEMIVGPDSPWIGKPIAAFDDTERTLLLAHQRVAHAPQILFDLDPRLPIEHGDKFIVAGDPHKLRRLLEPGTGEGTDVLWAGKIRRIGRVAYRTFVEMDLAVKVCSIALLVVILFSSAIYRYGLEQTWPDGLYRTISVIATGGEMGGASYEGWGKVFVSSLRIFGTIVVAAFTAIFTNYLIRARLGGVFEVRRIPDRGHVVVIGLGNVGLRVVEELLRMKERVVVLELKNDNTFIPSCRRLGAAVIVGNATRRETLKQAHADQARAVIVATSEDLVNLEIALLVAELNEQQRVVVRLGDAQLAETARVAAGVKMAVSLPEMAAPAFVAGLLGERVLGMFPVCGQMLAVLELSITNNDAVFLNHSVRSLAVDYRMLPVAVFPHDGKKPHEDWKHRLREGDRLLVLTAVPDLERIAQRLPVPTDWRVDVQAFPMSARETLLLQTRVQRNLSAEMAMLTVANLPFTLAEKQSRGQAEELLALLLREKIIATLVRVQ